MLALIGETACFVVNAVSYLAAIYMLLVMRHRARDPNRRKGTMREAMQYLQRFPPARWLLLTVAAASFCLAPMMTFMPVYAKDIFHGGPDALGFLMGASGVGAVIGGVHLANRRMVVGLDARIGTGCLAIGVALLAFAYNSLFLVALPILVLSGTSAILVVTARNMLLQHLVPEHLRGRVMAFFAMSFFGMLPLSAAASRWPRACDWRSTGFRSRRLRCNCCGVRAQAATSSP